MSEQQKKKKITAKEFDERFDRGEDMMDYVDLKTIKFNHPIQRINVDIPKQMLQKVDIEAAKIGVPRTSLIKMWIADNLGRLAN